MNPPKFSIVTVVLKDLGGLTVTAKSIFSQIFTDYEWIVCDGGSKDGTLDYLQALNSDSLTWISEPDHGIYDAMNKGVIMSRGEYVVFLNAGDCFTDNGVLADVILKLNAFQLKPVDVLCCGANLVIESGKIVYRPPKKVEDYIWHGLPANHQATYYRRLILETQPYDLSFKICGDYFLAATLYKQKAFFAYLDRAAVEFFLNGISYGWRSELFMEPWDIQKNILSVGIGRRILSFLKRFMANLALRIFSLPLVGRALLNIHSHIRSKK